VASRDLFSMFCTENLLATKILQKIYYKTLKIAPSQPPFLCVLAGVIDFCGPIGKKLKYLLQMHPNVCILFTFMMHVETSHWLNSLNCLRPKPAVLFCLVVNEFPQSDLYRVNNYAETLFR
jgi:hypothetical protein